MKTRLLKLILLLAAPSALAAGTAAEHDTEFFTSRVQGQAISNIAAAASNLAVSATNAVLGDAYGRSTAFVATNGNDSTALPGVPMRPYKTLQPAIVAGATRLVIGTGTYAGFTNAVGWTGTVAALGPVTISRINTTGTPLVVSANGAGLLTITDIYASGTNAPAAYYESFQGGPGGQIILADCTVGNITTRGGKGGDGDAANSYAGGKGGDGGNVVLTRATVTGTIDNSGGVGGVGGNDSAEYPATQGGEGGYASAGSVAY